MPLVESASRQNVVNAQGSRLFWRTLTSALAPTEFPMLLTGITMPGASLPMHDTTHLRTPVATAKQIGGRTAQPGVLGTIDPYTLEGHFNASLLWPKVVLYWWLYFPTPPGFAVGAIYWGKGVLTRTYQATITTDAIITGQLTLTFTDVVNIIRARINVP